MTRLAIFCDGTWSAKGAAHPTNVERLAEAVAPVAPDGIRQVRLYLGGVGTGRGLGDDASRLVDRLVGGTTGWGLDDNLRDVYAALVRRWSPGDEVFVFGFSRGAYTARSICGLIRRAGLLRNPTKARVAEALERYRSRDPEADADSDDSMAWRAAHAPDSPTSPREVAWRRAKGRAGPAQPFRVAYLGVWDTVGALGLPGNVASDAGVRSRHRFHDTNLSALVRRARHAVAVDERRLSFAPTLWTNLLDRNRAEMGLGPADDPLGPGGDPPYREEWFPGDHGAVGGGHGRLGLSSWACEWIAEGAAEAGLAISAAGLDAIRRSRAVGEPLITQPGGRVSPLWRLADRDGPGDPRSVSAAARKRIAVDPAYAPRTLAKVMRSLRP